jgi:hypothetical protein
MQRLTFLYLGSYLVVGGPRRSPKLTHFCSREMTQTEITV